MRKLTVFTVLFVLGLIFFPSQSHALTISPPKFILSADPGQRVETLMTVRNDTDRTLTFYPAFESYSTKGGEEPVFSKQDYGLPTWIKTDPPELTLGYKETASVSVIIDVPEDAEPGGHYATIFWSTLPPVGKGTGVGIITRVGALVLLDVSGDVVTAGELSNFKANKKFFNRLPVSFTYSLENKGTVHLGPEGKIVIKNLFGKTSAILDANPAKSHVLPGDTRTFPAANWEPEGGMPKIEGEGFFTDIKRELKGFAFGYYRAHLALEYGKKEIQTAQASFGFWVFPWRLITVSLLILGILLFGITKGIRTYNRWIISKVRESFNEKKKG